MFISISIPDHHRWASPFSRLQTDNFFCFFVSKRTNENLLTKSYRYDNDPREKTIKAARLKSFEYTDKSLSELLKKIADK
jgi:hypothetical protein